MGEPKVCLVAAGDPLSPSEVMDARRSPFQVRFREIGPVLPAEPPSLSRSSEKFARLTLISSGGTWTVSMIRGSYLCMADSRF